MEPGVGVDWRLEAGGWRLEAGGWRLEAGGWRLEAGGWRLETGDWRLETGLQPPASFYADYSGRMLSPASCEVAFDRVPRLYLPV
jgi:hypothetical protein